MLNFYGDIMKVLVACEFSQIVTQAFRKLGHDAYSCDILPTEGNSDYHIQTDVATILDQNWDLMIAHPSCQYLANSGVRWLYNSDKTINQDRYTNMIDACYFFNTLLNAPIPHICIENPIMHKHAKNYIHIPYTQIIQPYQFDEPYQKATCLWLKNLPPLIPSSNLTERKQQVHLESPSPDRWKNRSRTYPGIATQMAIQWSTYLTGKGL